MLIYEALYSAKKKLLPILKDKRFAYSAAETLLMHVLNISKEKLYVIFRDELPRKQLKQFKIIVNRRAGGEPLQYLTGKWWFYGREFIVKRGVLIPRQDTEALIDAVKSLVPGLAGNIIAADAGCGSGIIGITLKLEIPAIGQMWCIDKNSKAINLTGRNARKNKARIRLLHADFFTFAGRRKRKFGLVVSNPPYVSVTALKHLQKEVKREPESALAAGSKGMDFYVKFTRQAPEYLEKGGYLVLEIGDGMEKAVRRVFKGSEWSYITSFNDFRCKVRVLIFNYLG
jgi:release factor glutamine methyltransferase